MIKADGNEHANVAAAPEGRLWLMWEQNGTIHATRTNRTATRVGAVNALKPPGGGTIFRLNGEGSAGPLDLIANVNSGGQQGFWHQQVWPKLQLTASSRKAGKGRVVTFRVLDAGDPVPGALVKAGGRALRTAANGTARLTQATAVASACDGVEGRLRACRADHRPLSQSPFRAREGCTRGGSPGIFGKFGG